MIARTPWFEDCRREASETQRFVEVTADGERIKAGHTYRTNEDLRDWARIIRPHARQWIVFEE